ncbi:M20/M25/M40 family metallo-hydrolase [Azospirillum rugosum]|uniref:Acetylornithine deacetylase/succinyl-diaminopimelate desuccinylase-like protein n=1 Tax=Azospirillum rugosum TaxID=416170 RepID=A0ABS4SI49_9PROT|nr:M20/M25/M40 family metallo-hydrolase [Azospirillum rugosum]MBP2291874.1 acetylornithine deacetylase/succinyl-diaminopimelate desuccinylase-like protein [Azospirillum rugosum]MDQ0524314.1 acetylornithine deacetylase/succinyl-diaminopimelate desuccinylase-like protein [Azospirillum rugosum]
MKRLSLKQALALGAFVFLPLQANAASSSVDALAAKHASANYREFVELLAIPNDAVVPADIQKNAAWLERAFQKRGFQTRQLANNGKPMLYAELPDADPARKTVLFYAHLDGQSVTPQQWQQKSPWDAVLKRKNAKGEWEAIPLETLYGDQVDPEWRLFARSSSDDKGPIMMLLTAIDALKETGRKTSVNVKVILDSEEEKGSPSLGEVIRQNADLLKSDALLVLDGPMHQTNKPTLVFGNRGVALATVTVFGAKQGLHSGHFGNYSANPAMRLAQLLASMKDENGRVTIPGYYDSVKIDAAAEKIMAAVPDDETALRKRLGIAQAEKVGRNYQEALQYPSLNIRGMAAGDVGAKARTIIPESAVAELDLRTVPETPPEQLIGLLKKHIEAQGYHLVQGTPTDEERAQYDKLASVASEEVSASSSAARTDMQSAVGEWLYRSYKATYGEEPVRIRMMGGTVPTGSAVEALKVPFVIVPLVNADNNQHSYDENLRVGNFVSGVTGLIGVLQQPF